MQRITTLLILSLLSLTSLRAQTTEEEYRYMQQGVADVINKGVDIKAGYKLWPGTQIQYSPTVAISEKYLVRMADNSIAGIILIKIDPHSGALFMPIPHPASPPAMKERAYQYFSESFRYSMFTDSEKNFFQFAFLALQQEIWMKQREIQKK
jgi:hypothetical protein